MKRSTQNQRGQLLIEAVLLLVLLMGIWSAVMKAGKANNWFDGLVNGPWQAMSGMIETGIWKPPQQARGQHPNMFYRVVSWDPK